MLTPAKLSGPIIVAGHACLDISPEFPAGCAIPAPGALSEVGPATLSPGGAVSNVGLALHKLGVPVRMIAAAGDDLFGQGLRDQLASSGADVRLRVLPNSTTSYSVVLNPPGVDRSFLHSPAINHEFDPDRDVTDEDLEGAVALHFGYPPAMRGTYLDGGTSLARLFDRARKKRLTTSLDLCSPDPSVVTRIDWPGWFARVLPGVSMFCPSIEELRALMRLKPREDVEDVPDLAQRMLDFGAGAVCIKLGSRGLYLLQGRDEFWQPCLPAKFVSANGAGDCTIAGLLTATLCGYPPAEAARLACCVGACSVESISATGGIIPWDKVLVRAERRS